MNALVLCAGLGTRFQPITNVTPKPAIPFLNVPLLGYSLYYLEQIGVTNLVINTHHLPDKVQAVARQLTQARAQMPGRNYSVKFSHEPEILGSGGGIAQARSLLGYDSALGNAAGGAGVGAAVAAATPHATNDFIVSNGDEVLLFAHGRGYAPLIEFHRAQGALATLLTTDHPEAGRTLGGVWVDDNAATLPRLLQLPPPHGVITKLGGTAPELPGARHFTGVFIFSPRIFSYMPTHGGPFHIFKDCLHQAMAAGEKVLSYHDPSLLWLDMSSEKDHSLSTRIARDHLERKTPNADTLRKILQRFNA